MSRVGTERQLSEPKLPAHIWLIGLAFRTLLIVLLAVVTMRVSSPQIETIWSAYETPSEVVRMVLGFAVVVFMAVQIFKLPKDAEAYRTWIYLGLTVVPLSALCAVVIW